MNKFILFLIFGLIIFSPKIIMQAYCLDLIPTTSEKIANVIYKDKKKYKFIYFFTSWCYECNETLDKLHKMQLDRNLSQKLRINLKFFTLINLLKLRSSL